MTAEIPDAGYPKGSVEDLTHFVAENAVVLRFLGEPPAIEPETSQAGMPAEGPDRSAQVWSGGSVWD